MRLTPCWPGTMNWHANACGGLTCRPSWITRAGLWVAKTLISTVGAPSNVSHKNWRRPRSAVRPRQVESLMYGRDGWRCRFCGCRVVLKLARDRIVKLLPGVVRLGPRMRDCHAAFLALSAVPD